MSDIQIVTRRELEGLALALKLNLFTTQDLRKILEITHKTRNKRKITPKSKYDIDITFGKPLSVSELAFALTQLATYIRAGISLIDSVRILAKQTPNNSKRKIYELFKVICLISSFYSRYPDGVRNLLLTTEKINQNTKGLSYQVHNEPIKALQTLCNAEIISLEATKVSANEVKAFSDRIKFILSQFPKIVKMFENKMIGPVVEGSRLIENKKRDAECKSALCAITNRTATHRRSKDCPL